MRSRRQPPGRLHAWQVVCNTRSPPNRDNRHEDRRRTRPPRHGRPRVSSSTELMATADQEPRAAHVRGSGGDRRERCRSPRGRLQSTSSGFPPTARRHLLAVGSSSERLPGTPRNPAVSRTRPVAQRLEHYEVSRVQSYGCAPSLPPRHVGSTVEELRLHAPTRPNSGTREAGWCSRFRSERQTSSAALEHPCKHRRHRDGGALPDLECGGPTDGRAQLWTRRYSFWGDGTHSAKSRHRSADFVSQPAAYGCLFPTLST